MINKIKEVDRFLTIVGKRLLPVVKSDLRHDNSVSNIEYDGYFINDNGVNFKFRYDAFLTDGETARYFMSFEDLEKQKV